MHLKKFNPLTKQNVDIFQLYKINIAETAYGLNPSARTLSLWSTDILKTNQVQCAWEMNNKKYNKVSDFERTHNKEKDECKSLKKLELE